MLSEGKFQHAPPSELFEKDVGENIASAGTSGAPPTVVEEAVKATQEWYNELNKPGYDFNNPGWSSDVGHFTQVRHKRDLY